MSCVLVSCCGLPAAGKTSFCRSVVEHIATDAGPLTVAVNTLADATTARDVFAPPSPNATQNKSTGASTFKKVQHRVKDDTSVRVSHVCFDEYIEGARCRHEQRQCDRRRVRCQNDRPFWTNGERPPTNREEDEFTEHQEMQDPFESIKNREGDNIERKDIDTMAFGDGAARVDAPEESPGNRSAEKGTHWWHEGRRDALGEIKKLAAAAAAAQTDERTHSSCADGTKPTMSESMSNLRRGRTDRKTSLLHVVLADDNMHFRSMRHEVLHLARTHECGYAQLYFPIDADSAVERDQERAAPVAEAVIRKMAMSLQPPDPERFPWERHTAVITPSQVYNRTSVNGDGMAETSECVGDSTPGPASAAFKSFCQVVAAAVADPRFPIHPSSTVAEQEDDRVATGASLLHHIDLDLRESVRRVARKTVEAGFSRETIRVVMSACSVCRKTVMRRARATHHDKGHDVGADREVISICDNYGRSKEGRTHEQAVGLDTYNIKAGSPRAEFMRELQEALLDRSEIGASVLACIVEATQRIGDT